MLMFLLLVACSNGSDGSGAAPGDTPGDPPGDDSPSSLVVGLVVKNNLDQGRANEPADISTSLFLLR